MAFNSDNFINQNIFVNGQNYKIVEYIKSGAVGHMFRCRNDELGDDRAVKFILRDSLKSEWENEIKKAIVLHRQGNVVNYYTHNYCTMDGEEYLYIMFEYINNDTLKSMIDNKDITVTLLKDVIITLLYVFHACKETGIIHADLHAGNILIEKGDIINIDKTYRKIWVTDFSRVTKKSNIEYIDDYTGLINIIKESLDAIDFHALDGEGKRLSSVIKDELVKLLRETNIMIDGSARNPEILLNKFQILINKSENKEKKAIPEINDYLAAEHLGDNFDEWKALFVPKFIAINELLEKNICVITGLRGCGKTMLFKRLTSYFNIMMDGPAGFDSSDEFYGFYINARDIAETFPWLPENKEVEASNQLLHNFNLKWTLEILIWIRELIKNKNYDLTFLNEFFIKYFPGYFSVGIDNSIFYLIDLIKEELEKSRLKSNYHSKDWALTQYDYLETFISLIKEKIVFIENKPFFFFLDDYSLPMVKSTIQRILNPIVFRRSAHIIFKISTESAESFLRVGLNSKALEENDDYRLIDCGRLIFLKKERECKEIIFEIIKKRIERHQLLRGRDLTLAKMLGETRFNDEKRAILIRNESLDEEKEGTKYLYQGWKVFYRMWTSDVREMINIFADMIFLEDDLVKSNFKISDKTQDKVYKDSGGQFINLLGSATNPDEESLKKESTHNYGRHLFEIVEAFHQVASFDLKNKKSKNLGKNTIKKARRIEVTNTEKSLTKEASDYYSGLIRYGIFVQDYRGKSVRGKVAPRLFLRSRLIPFFRLAFSKRDSITMPWEDLNTWLLKPTEYVDEYKKKSNADINSNKNQQQLPFDGEA